MSRDYKHVPKQKSKPKGDPLGATLTFITGLSLGLFVALFVYLHQSDSSYAPFNFSFTKDTTETAEQLEPATKQEGPPAPQFDFYNILPNKEINISEWVAEDLTLSSTAAEDESSVYILQVGSFRQLEAADQVKAQLALLGISADIQRVVINGQDTRYRVRVGPYVEQSRLNEERRRLQENNLEFMLLKLQADDPRVSDG
jgi:cell division protein FtsN